MAPSQLWAYCLERWVCSVNIERMRAQLATATEQPERATLWRLLREQENTLQRLVAQDRPDVPAGGARTDDAARPADAADAGRLVVRPLGEEPFH